MSKRPIAMVDLETNESSKKTRTSCAMASSKGTSRASTPNTKEKIARVKQELAPKQRVLSDITERHNSRVHSGTGTGIENEDSAFRAQMFDLLRKGAFIAEHGEIASATASGADTTVAYMTKKGRWSVEAMQLLAGSRVTIISFEGYNKAITPSILSAIPPKITALPFPALHTLNLAGQSITGRELSYLRFLPRLQVLNLEDTGLNSDAIFHLICHHETLEKLKLCGNDKITDHCVPALQKLTALRHLYLRGTSITPTGLRAIVSHRKPELFRVLSAPQSFIDYSTKERNRCYSIDIPAGYLTNPFNLGNFPLSVLKKNLELHAKHNKSISLLGEARILAERLSKILMMRKEDEKVLSHMGMKCFTEEEIEEMERKG